MAEEVGGRNAGELAELVGEMGLIVETAVEGEIGPAREVPMAIGREYRLETHNASEGFWLQADGGEEAAVKLAGAEVDGLGKLIHAGGAGGLLNEDYGPGDGGVRDVGGGLDVQRGEMPGEFIGGNAQKCAGGGRAEADSAGGHGTGGMEVKR